MSYALLNEPIAIVGMACRFPKAPSLETYWQLLKKGQAAISRVPAERWDLDTLYSTEDGALGKMNSPFGGFIQDIEQFDAAFFGVSESEAAGMDPQQRLLMELSWEVLENAGQAPEELKGTDVGVFVGLSSADYAQTRLQDPQQMDMYSITGVSASVTANRLSYFYDLRGPSLVIDTACSSSLVAVHQACQSLRLGECSLALAGGVNILLSPLISIGFAQAYVTAPDGKCKAFDASANGIVRGEGGGLVLLKPLAKALKDRDRIFAVIEGSALGQDGLTNGLTAPNPAGQRAVLQRAYQGSGLDPTEVDYIETHGTGTKLGDPIEAKALADVLCNARQTTLRIGSVKSNIGHLEAAAGIAGLIKSALSLHHQALPPSLHFETPNPLIPFEKYKLKVQTHWEETPLHHIGVSAFGFGGTNAHVVLGQAPQVAQHATTTPLFLGVSAHSSQALEQRIAQLNPLLETHRFEDVAYTLSRQNHPLPFRGAYTPGQGWTSQKVSPRPVVFVFSGMGSQSLTMGRQLLHIPAFVDSLNKVDKGLKAHQDWSVLQAIREGFEPEAEIVQPLIFALQVALFELWKAHGVIPNKVLGSSMGEVAAAYCSGAIDLDTACLVINRRVRVLKQLEGQGSLAIVGLSQSELMPRLKDRPVYIAALNSPSLTIVAAEEAPLQDFCKALQEEEIFVRPVKGATAPSHTPLIDPLKEALFEALGECKGQQNQISFFSTVLAQEISGESIDGHYWWQNCRQPIQMIPTLENIEALEPHTYIEISPHPVVMNGLKELGGQLNRELMVLPSLQREDALDESFVHSLATLWALGHEVKVPHPQGKLLSLPPYPWQKSPYWLEPQTGFVPPASRPQVPQATLESHSSVQTLDLPGIQNYLRAQIAQALHMPLEAMDIEQPLSQLGIGSLVGMELYNRVKKEFQVNLPLSEFLKGPSVVDLSRLIAERTRISSPSLELLPRPEYPPLSPTQKRFWFFEQLGQAGQAYHIPIGVTLTGPINLAQLQAALDTLVERHEILRTLYLTTPQGEPYQKVLHQHPCPFEVAQVPQHDWETRTQELIQHPFDLTTEPPFRVNVMQANPELSLLLLDMHHLLADGLSFRVIFEEIKALYEGHNLPELPYQFIDEVLLQAQENTRESLRYWSQKMQGAPEFLPLPTDFQRPPRECFQGRQYSIILSKKRLKHLEKLATEQGVTLFVLLLSAYYVLLYRLTQQEDLVVGTPIAARLRSEAEQLIGPFLNMLPLRQSLSPEMSFAQLCQSVKKMTLDAFDHQNLPFESLVEALSPSRSLGYHPVFQSVFALHGEVATPNLGELEVQPFEIDNRVSRFDLTFTFRPTAQGLQGHIEYKTALFASSTIADWTRSYQALLENITPEAPISTLNLGVPLYLKGETHPTTLNVLERISEQDPASLALQTPSGISWTYGQLWDKACRIAAYFKAHQVKRVATTIPGCPELVTLWLGTWISGACYIGLDPQSPRKRLKHQLQLSEADMGFGETLQGLLNTPTWDELTEIAPLENIQTPPPQSLAYILLTSGSTGEPKAVPIQHAQLQNLLVWHLGTHPLAPGDRVSQMANPAFDAAGWEIWPALASGAALYFAPQQLNESGWINWFHTRGVTQAFVPTPLLERLLPEPWPESMALERVLTGGAALKAVPEKRHPFSLFNHYGPTENTVVTTMASVSPEQGAPPPIGLPIWNTTLMVVDPQQNPLPAGLPGELCILGQSLSPGYLNDLPGFFEHQGKPAYATGDRVRISQGQLQFLGRLDQQVQLRGMRVEPAEIAHCLMSHPEVQQAVVLEKHKQLWAYISPQADTQEIKAHLKKHLPPAMVPTQIMALPELPLNSRGKIDLKALPDARAQTQVTQSLPRGETETQLALIWHHLLQQTIYRESHFFELGGHSLLVMDLVREVAQDMGKSLAMVAVFENPTLSAMAQHIAQAPEALQKAFISQPEQAFEPFELTEVQKAYWIGRRDDMALGAFSAHAYVELGFQTLDLGKLESVINALIQRHPMLRAVIQPSGQQQVLPEVPFYILKTHDFRDRDDKAAQSALKDIRERLSHEVRAADQWPLFGFEVSLWPDHHRLHCSLDALIMDAGSMGLLAREIGLLYRQPSEPLPTLQGSFRDYVQYVQSLRSTPAYAQAKTYWQDRIADFARSPELPPPLKQTETSGFKHLESTLPPEYWSRLKTKAQDWGVSPNALLMSIFASVLHVWCPHQEKLALNLTTFHRLDIHPQVHQWVGDFTQLNLLEVAFNPADFKAQTRALQARLLEDLDHALYDGISVMRDLRQSHGEAAALMPIVFTSLLGADFEMPLEAEVLYQVAQTPQVTLDHQVRETQGGLYFAWDYLESAFPQGLIQEIFACYQRALLQVAQGELLAPYNTLGEIHWQARHKCNTFAFEYPEHLLHAGIFRQAPERIALETATATWTYGQLTQKAWALSQTLELEPGELVPIVMPKGPEQVVAVLAVLLAGGAYLPLQGDWPKERLSWIIAHSDARWAIAAPEHLLDLPQVQWVTQLPPTQPFSPRDLEQQLQKSQPDQTAYVIFTSGSTGQPKGVMLSHKAAMNTIQDIWQRFAFDQNDVFFGISALSFDLSVFDIFGPLSYGAKLVLPSAHELKEPRAWVKLCQEKHVSVWNSVPTLMKMLTAFAQNHPERQLPTLKTVMLSGDWIPLGLPSEVWQVAPEAQMYSLGGATEAAIWSIYYPIHAVQPEWSSIPYGTPLNGQPFYVLGPQLQDCPTWVIGDLYIGGKGLAQGYFKDLEKTQERFIVHPQSGQRLYKTGDQGRYWPDGTLEFMGRQDFQVKIQGYRIELGEIEHALETHSQIRQALVMARGENQSEKYLQAYVQTETPLTQQNIEEWLKERLPAYMVPRECVFLEQFPLLSSGKIDRHALPQATVEQPATPQQVFGPLQTILTLARETLDRPDLEPHLDLLSMGVNSVDMVRLGHQLESHFGFTPGVGELFQLRTLQALAQYYERSDTPVSNTSELVVDPQEREHFKAADKGFRELRTPGIALPPASPDHQPYTSIRDYGIAPISQVAFSSWLAQLAQTQDGYAYPSAGGLYPVQVYLYLKPLAVEGLQAGSYYYNRRTHHMHLMQAGERHQEIHFPINQPWTSESRFELFLVADMRAIAPMYGPDARDYALIEAGAMGQILRLKAPENGIGFCAVAQVNPGPLKQRFQWTEHHVLLHTLVGGILPGEEEWEEFII